MRALVIALLFALAFNAYSQEHPTKTGEVNREEAKLIQSKSEGEGDSVEALNGKIALLQLKYNKLLDKLESGLIEKQQQQSTEPPALNYSVLAEELRTLKHQLNELRYVSNLVKVNENHNDWIGILLVAASLVFTGLSFILGILALWGYRNIKSGAVESAIKQSNSVIASRIEKGEFNDIISRAVERTIYRDVLSANDFPENPDDDNES
ncbi:hypothetical protein [Idiomarina aquatica]|uniref:Uncharacterized protein n=1 Tax=Idiomarina aquatica TaxID=1327752 RepID=A0AA94JCR8_9GAMM|nr:hypothetical protein [Idiomarina aquatica]RUO42425.1 hypothetical protein CWE23_09995 [Idiomarina aquatica]